MSYRNCLRQQTVKEVTGYEIIAVVRFGNI